MLLSTFKRLLRNYYLEALHSCYDAEDPKTWKSVYLNCNSCRSLQGRRNDVKARGADFRERALLN
jgi:hypothetical protein